MIKEAVQESTPTNDDAGMFGCIPDEALTMIKKAVQESTSTNEDAVMFGCIPADPEVLAMIEDVMRGDKCSDNNIYK